MIIKHPGGFDFDFGEPSKTTITKKTFTVTVDGQEYEGVVVGTVSEHDMTIEVDWDNYAPDNYEEIEDKIREMI